jgi:hypothetical protein
MNSFILPKRPSAILAYFTMLKYSFKNCFSSKYIYSTRKTLGPFLFEALFFLWPLSKATAL